MYRRKGKGIYFAMDEKRRIRILSVDDDRVAQMAIKRTLASRGLLCEITEARTIEEAMRLLVANSYDLVLVDYLLPDGTGLDLLERIRDTPAIFITGSGDEGVAVRAMKGGAYDYLIKDPEGGYLELLPVTIEKALRTYQMEQEHRSYEKKIVRQNAELEEINSELAALYEISSTISRTIDLKSLLKGVLETLPRVNILKVEDKAMIFTVEDNGLRLAAHTGMGDDFVRAHEGLKLGECLCGLSAQTGEAILSTNSHEDSRHTIHYPGMTPHGHVILPLKAADRVVGVMCIYMPVGVEPSEQTVKLLTSIADQLGVAVNNARLFEQTRNMSLQDPLTGLANRRHMHMELERNLAVAQRYGTPLSVVMMDIDHFKEYNDTYGHLEGDRLLVEIARIISRETRDADFASRYGGEEFLMLLPETDLVGAYSIAERIRKAVEQETRVTISLGVSAYHGGMKNAEELINTADEALYRAKQNGRNRVEVYQAKLAEEKA